MKASILVIILLSSVEIGHAQVIDVTIKGVDDGIRTNRQQDYNEALMNAKIQAIERAGVEIQSITKIVNFQLKFQAAESKAKAILLPGFQVVDIGYTADGTYQVVLTGKVRVGEGITGEEKKFKGMIPVDESYVVTKRADIYKSPNVGSEIATTLEAGVEVRAKARSEDRKWYFVRQKDRDIGFIFSSYVEAAQSYWAKKNEEVEKERKEEERKKREQAERESEELLNKRYR